MNRSRLAAIDIGTNSIRSIVVETDPGHAAGFRILDDEKVAVRLGEGLNASGSLSATAIDRAIEALSRQKLIIDAYQVRAIEAIATSAVRKAKNGKTFIKTIKNRVGLNVTTISGDEEAELAALSAFNNFDLEESRHLLVDIGGGSLELVTTIGRHIEKTFSLELGAVYLTESFISGDPASSESLLTLRRHIRKTLRDAFTDRPAVSSVIGSGGTVTSLASMTAAARKQMLTSMHGYELLRSDTVHLLAMLQRKSLKERRDVPGLNADRADIIIAGAIVIDELLDFFDVNLLRVNDRGIREGMILRGLRKHGMLSVAAPHRTWKSSVLAFAAACHFEKNHALHVARLAMAIFKVLAKPFGLDERDGRLLEAAALLHDVGYFINYSSHHKHSYHLIRHADLFGFTPQEREVIAHIARYHRKSLPKKKHESYMRLSPEERQQVSRLGGILRLADGLDRSRTGVVTVSEILFSPSRLVIRLRSCSDPSVEIYGGIAKSDLFTSAFHLDVVLEPTTPSPTNP